MWTKTIWWLRFAVVLWVASIGVVTALQAVGLVPALPKLSPYVWVISLVILGVDNLGTLISRKYNSNKRRTLDEIERALMTLVITVAHETTLRFEDLGAGVYVISTHWWKRGSKEQLSRIKRFRPAGYPQQSGISWSSRTGAVGECLRTRKPVHKNWQRLAEKYGEVEVPDEQFNKMPEQTRCGFTRDEFNTIVGKYSEVLAVPIWHGRKERTMLGILTVDRAFKGQDDNFISRLQSTRDVAASAASVVSRSLKPSGTEVG
jgi:hypothetical protein